MLSSPLLSFTPQHPKTLASRTFRRLPPPKDPILIPNLRSKRNLGGRFGLFHGGNMAEMVQIGAFGGGYGGEDGKDVGPINGALDIRGFDSNLNRASKWIVAAYFAIYMLWRHDAEALWAAMGSVINVRISVALKTILNHERPVSASKSDPGMPSSHAQSFFYITSYVVIALFDWLGTNMLTMTAGAILLACSCYLSWLRVSQQFHTTSQVIVGGILGSAFAATWFWLWHPFVQTAFANSIFVRIIVVLGSLSFCAAFVIHVIQHWLGDEE